MKHTIKFKKAILDIDRRALGYYTISDSSIYNLVFHIAELTGGTSVRKLKLRERCSDFRCKLVVYCTSDTVWHKFLREFLDTFSNKIENVSIK